MNTIVRCAEPCPNRWNPNAVCQREAGHRGDHFHEEPIGGRSHATTWNEATSYLNVMIW